jgi:hypothetical protein
MKFELLKTQIVNNQYFKKFSLDLSLVNKKIGKIDKKDNLVKEEVLKILDKIIKENMFLQENYMVVKK